MTVLVTGAAGFIGFHLCRRLLQTGHAVLGADNLNDYYSIALKKARLDLLCPLPGFSFSLLDMADAQGVAALFREKSFSHVVHLAAQAGVRYSLECPRAYVLSNLVGFANLVEACRGSGVRHLVFASSSSVYGGNARLPFRETDSVDHPVSLYAASKKSNELMAHVYSHLYGLPATGLRFFTVYGPWGRPDMALFIFTRAILAGEPLPVFARGRLRRDFTYIDDVVAAVESVIPKPPGPAPDWDPLLPRADRSAAPYRLYNVGSGRAEEVNTLIALLERGLGRKAVRDFLSSQPGDVEATCADVTAMRREFDWRPRVSLEEGVERFLLWFRQYHGV
ncbi:MAG: NAD-dependent epimerase/dehydratase family protein [Desulfovibrio sp.]|nr:NAD-dependent epimerase/dehydratase family protein [Desulfovibrio sp.]